MTRASTSPASIEKTGKYTKTAEQKGHEERPAELHVLKTGRRQSQTAEHRSYEDRPVTANGTKNGEDTTKLQRTHACNSTNHGERCKCTGVTHHGTYQRLSSILSLPKTPEQTFPTRDIFQWRSWDIVARFQHTRSSQMRNTVATCPFRFA